MCEFNERKVDIIGFFFRVPPLVLLIRSNLNRVGKGCGIVFCRNTARFAIFFFFFFAFPWSRLVGLIQLEFLLFPQNFKGGGGA